MSRKSDVEKLLGILEEFEEGTILQAVAQLGGAVEVGSAVPQPIGQ